MNICIPSITISISINVFVTFNQICEKFVSRFRQIRTSKCSNVGTEPQDRRPPHSTRATHAPTEHQQTSDLNVRKEIVFLSRDTLAETFCTNIMRLYILNIFEYFCRNIFFTTNFINKFLRLWKLSVFVVLTKVFFFFVCLRSKHALFPTGHIKMQRMMRLLLYPDAGAVNMWRKKMADHA